MVIARNFRWKKCFPSIWIYVSVTPKPHSLLTCLSVIELFRLAKLLKPKIYGKQNSFKSSVFSDLETLCQITFSLQTAVLGGMSCSVFVMFRWGNVHVTALTNANHVFQVHTAFPELRNMVSQYSFFFPDQQHQRKIWILP